MSLLAAALSACGAGAVDSATATAGMPVQTAAATRSVDLSIDPAAVGHTPAPDCADQGCADLRIIDGNAEAYRLDAMRRAVQGDDA